MTESVQYFNLDYLADSMTGKVKLSNSCADSQFWDGWYPRLRMAVLVIFLLFYVFMVPALSLFARKRSSEARRILKPLTFGFAVAQVAVALFIAVIGDCLLNCYKLTSLKYLKVYTVLNVLKTTSSILILGVVCFHVIPTVKSHAGTGSGKMSKMIHLALGVLVVIFAIPFQTIYNYNNIHRVVYGNMVDMKHGVFATYVTLYLVWALSAAACLMVASGKASVKGLTPLAAVLAICIIGFALVDLIVIFGWQVTLRDWNMTTSSVFGILSLYFQANTYLSIIGIGYVLKGGAVPMHEDKEGIHGRNGHNDVHHSNGA